MRDYVLLYLNGERLELRGAEVFRPLAEFLRERRGLIGTRVACGEGACGSCTVLLGEPNGDESERLRYRSVNACLLRLFQADCRHVVTVEGLGGADGGLSPVQKAMAENGGAQCGFCTPGVVVSLSLLAGGGPLGGPVTESPPSEAAVRDALAGNLCRCTGYLPIFQSAERIEAGAIGEWRDPFPTEQIARELAAASATSLDLSDGTRRVFRPASLADALAFRADHPEAVVVAGGTALPEADRVRAEGTVLSLYGLPELSGIARDGGALVIGALVNWEDLRTASREPFFELSCLLSQFGSPQIRALGTVGGEVVASESNGDVLPLLLVQGATLTLRSHEHGERRVSYADFLAGDRCRPDELLAGITLPLPRPGEIVKAYKVARRKAFDRSVFCAAVAVRLSEDGATIAEARLAAGGVAPLPMSLSAAEAVLTGAPFTEETMRRAGEAAAAEIDPPHDAYAGPDHRRRLTRNLPLRFFHDVTTASEGPACAR